MKAVGGRWSVVSYHVSRLRAPGYTLAHQQRTRSIYPHFGAADMAGGI